MHIAGRWGRVLSWSLLALALVVAFPACGGGGGGYGGGGGDCATGTLDLTGGPNTAYISGEGSAAVPGTYTVGAGSHDVTASGGFSSSVFVPGCGFATLFVPSGF